MSRVHSRTYTFGSYGAIPDSVFIQKLYGQTLVYEDEDQLDNYFRATLKDRTPDPRTFASEEPRAGGFDPVTGEARGGNESKGRLALRYHGSRRGLDPDHSEQFFELTEREPRGIALGPDFKKFKTHGYARRNDYNFKPDAHPHIIEGVTGYVRDIKRRRDLFVLTKPRYRIFSTSKNNFNTGGINPFPVKSNVSKVHNTGEIIDINDSPPEVRRGNTGVLTNKLKIGHRGPTPDQEFKVAKYGKLYDHLESLKKMEFQKNRRDAGEGDIKLTIFRDNVVPRALAVRMAQLSNARKQPHYTSLDSEFAKSKRGNTNRPNISNFTNNIYDNRNDTEVSQNQLKAMENSIKNYKKSNPNNQYSNNRNDTFAEIKIAKTIEQLTKTRSHPKNNFSKENLQNTLKSEIRNYREHKLKNNPSANKFNDKYMKNRTETKVKVNGKSKKVHKYTTKHREDFSISNYGTEKYKKQSKNTIKYTTNKKNALYGNNMDNLNTREDSEFGDNLYKNRRIAPVQSKNMNFSLFDRNTRDETMEDKIGEIGFSSRIKS